MQATLWRKGQQLGKHTPADREKFCGGRDFPIFPVVLDGDEIAAPQPFDPDTNNAWPNEAEALAWANRWIAANEENAKAVPFDPDTEVIQFS